eukprot:211180-Pyramimonas_sp.AAC.1
MTGTPCGLWGRDPLLWRPRDPLYARKEPLRPGAWEGEADVEKEEEDLTSAVGRGRSLPGDYQETTEYQESKESKDNGANTNVQM